MSNTLSLSADPGAQAAPFGASLRMDSSMLGKRSAAKCEASRRPKAYEVTKGMRIRGSLFTALNVAPFLGNIYIYI